MASTEYFREINRLSESINTNELFPVDSFRSPEVLSIDQVTRYHTNIPIKHPNSPLRVADITDVFELTFKDGSRKAISIPGMELANYAETLFKKGFIHFLDLGTLTNNNSEQLSFPFHPVVSLLNYHSPKDYQTHYDHITKVKRILEQAGLKVNSVKGRGYSLIEDTEFINNAFESSVISILFNNRNLVPPQSLEFRINKSHEADVFRIFGVRIQSDDEYPNQNLIFIEKNLTGYDVITSNDVPFGALFSLLTMPKRSFAPGEIFTSTGKPIYKIKSIRQSIKDILDGIDIVSLSMKSKLPEIRLKPDLKVYFVPSSLAQRQHLKQTTQ